MPWIFSELLSIERLTVAISGLPQSLAGTKIVQLSDLHYDGECLSENLLRRALEASAKEEPDLVLLTGDYVTDDPTWIEQLVLRLKHLDSRAGVYACLGNHDNYFSYSKEIVTKALTDVGIEVLWNEIAYPLGKALPVVGLADFWSREFNPNAVMERIDPLVPRIVLSHNPDTAKILQKWRVDLQLSGHSHGGQVAIPGYGSAPILLESLRRIAPKSWRKWIPYLKKSAEVMEHWQWARGLHRVGTNQLYVNRGLGTYAPGRLFCPPELTVITLVKEQASC